MLFKKKTSFFRLINDDQGHGCKLRVIFTRKGQNPSVFSSDHFKVSVALNI
jgi:hypothetical protein